MKHPALFLAALGLASAALADPSTIGEGDSYAWAPNIGWLELRPNAPTFGEGIVLTDTHLSGFAWSDSTGWINFGDGTPANGIRYGNADGADSGVNHDGAGNLSGLAWSANLGWINFGWANATDPNRPRFDLLSGGFSGYAWSANSGWINLDTGILKTDALCIVDSDADGISDAWELDRAVQGQKSGLGVFTAGGDADGDGVSDKNEYLADTDPLDPTDRLRILAIGPSEGGSSLTWTSRPTRLYRTADSTDLVEWIWSESLTAQEGPQTTSDVNHNADRHHFFKVQAVLPLKKN